VATCAQCGADTQLHSGGVPICLACREAREQKQQPAPKPKPPQSQRTLSSINARLTATRAEYRHALAVQIENQRLMDTLGPGSDRGRALRTANVELSVATGKYEDALREFIAFTDPHRRAS
jgi:hypothetical protein